jgi:hypothetical protein
MQRRIVIKQLVFATGAMALMSSCTQENSKASIPLKKIKVGANQQEMLKELTEPKLNFAGLLKVPGIYFQEFNDEVCPPSSTFAAYNVISTPKMLNIVPETGHWVYLEQSQKMSNWMEVQLKVKK